MLFLHSWRSMVPSGIIFLLVWRSSISIYISHLCIKSSGDGLSYFSFIWKCIYFTFISIFTRHRILSWWVFFSPQPVKMLFCHYAYIVSDEKSSIFQPIPLILMGYINLAFVSNSLYSFICFMVCLGVVSFVLVSH